MIFASFWYKRKRGVGQHDAAKPSPKRGMDAAQLRDGGQSPTTRGEAALLGAQRRITPKKR